MTLQKEAYASSLVPRGDPQWEGSTHQRGSTLFPKYTILFLIKRYFIHQVLDLVGDRRRERERERERERDRDGRQILLREWSSIFSHGYSRMHKRWLKHLIQSILFERVELLCLCPLHVCFFYSCSLPSGLCLSWVCLLSLSPPFLTILGRKKKKKSQEIIFYAFNFFFFFFYI